MVGQQVASDSFAPGMLYLLVMLFLLWSVF